MKVKEVPDLFISPDWQASINKSMVYLLI